VRVVSGVVALVLGLVALFGAIGLQTVWAPPATLTATTGTAGGAPAEAPLTVVTGGINEVDDEAVEYSLAGEGDYTVMLGQTRDIEAWVGDAAHNTVTGIDTDVPRGESPRVQIEHTEGEATTPNPAGSDLWVDEQDATGTIDQRWSVPAEGEWALLVATDGTRPAPTDLSVTWTNDIGDSPWIVPLFVIGSLLVLVGIGLLVWALLVRRRQNPDHDGGPGAGGRSGSARRSAAVPLPPNRPPRHGGTGQARMAGAVVAVALTTAVAVAPATADTPAGAPSSEAPAADDGAYPLVASSQLERILERISVATRQGDKSQDVDAMRPRVAGQALEMRSYNYRNREASNEVEPADRLAASPVLSVLAESDPAFPRTITAVTEGEANDTPQILVLQQNSARAQYKLIATTPMTPGSQMPSGDVSDTSVETVAPDDATGLVMSPSTALGGTARYLTDAQDPFGERFVANPYIDEIHEYQDGVVDDSPDARVALSRQALPEATVALRLPDGSALVVGHYNARTTFSPREEGDVVVMSELATQRAGEDSNETTSPVHMAYREVVAVRVPADGATGNDAKVSLVGMTDELQAVTFE
jgi:hypothetical protein